MHHKSRSYDVWFLRYKVQRTKFFVILGHFCPFDTPNNPPPQKKKKNLDRIKKRLEILSFYSHVPQMTITWCMVSKISSTTDRIFFHFGLFFALYPLTQTIKILNKWKKLPEILSFYTWVPSNKNHMMYDFWDMECDRQNFFSFQTIFCPFIPPPPPPLKNQNFKKMKKNHRDIILLHKYTINDNHMIYGSWDINCNRYIFFVILGHFLPKKWKHQENEKKP